MRDLVTALGEHVSIRENLQRIVCLSPAVTEILFELGLGERLVGLSAFCARPHAAAGIRKVGSYGSARIEVIREMKPDVIFTVSGYPEEFSRKLSKEFPVYVFELPSSVAGIVDLVRKVGVVSERPEEAAMIEAELLQKIPRRGGRKGKAYVEIDLGGPVSFGYRSYITDALSLLGLESIYSKRDSEWLVPDMSFIAESDPDLIFYEPKMYSRFTDSDRERMIAERGWNGLAAVKNGKLFVSPGPLDFIAHHGPTFIREVLPWMSNRI